MPTPQPMGRSAAKHLTTLCLAATPLLQACGGGGGTDSAAQAATPNPACTRDSALNPDGSLGSRTMAYLCATYGVTTTRSDANGAAITMDYFVSAPAGGKAAKATVVLIAGSGFDTRITGTVDGGPATGSSGNFLVRSAQLFANAGYQVVTLDRPADAALGPYADELANVDRYRTSVRHAIDILTVANRINTGNLALYIVGTSRGSISVVANNLIASGIGISSAVTRGRAEIPEQLYVGDPRTARLLAGSVRRPSLVLQNELDECAITPPAGSTALYNALHDAGVDATSALANGGFKVTSGASAADLDPCQSLGYHSYMGIENLAVGRTTQWLDGRVALQGANRHPKALFATVAAAPAPATQQINLALLATDPDGDAPSYELPYAETSLGGSVALNGTIVTYTPPTGVAGRTDRFVYAVTDGRGGVGAAVVAMEIGR